MTKNSSLQVTFLLDCMRGRRGGKVPTGEKSSGAPPAIPKSSLKLLQPLVQQFPDRFTVSLYHTPDLRGVWKKVIPNTYLLLLLFPSFSSLTLFLFRLL